MVKPEVRRGLWVIAYRGGSAGLKGLAPVWLAGGVVMAAAAKLLFAPVALASAGAPLPSAAFGPADELAGAPPAGFKVAPFVIPEADKAARAQAVGCLTEAVYYEAGFEPVAGQRAVAQVILNRVRDPNFPDTVCGVVYQGWERATGCQFSFVCDGSRERRPPGPAEWGRARKVAEAALNGYVADEVGTATHYHVIRTRAWWKGTLIKVTALGDHVFYRWPGQAGTPQALKARYKGEELDY